MGKIFHPGYTAFGVKRDKAIENHFDNKISSELKTKIASMGLQRVAGNVYECFSTKDFWKVQGNTILRLSADEVDNGEKIAPAPKDNPAAFLSSILDELEF